MRRTDMPEFWVWSAMLQRCNNPKNRSYARYGGRGITVCERWMSFDAFIADMGRRPGADLTLERADNSDGYRPENCRWATRKEQQRNMRRNRRIVFRGESLTLGEWAARIGITYQALQARLTKWPLERAMTKPSSVCCTEELGAEA